MTDKPGTQERDNPIAKTKLGERLSASNRILLAVVLTLIAILGFDTMGVMVKVLTGRGYTAPELSAYRNTLGMLPSLILILMLGEVKLTRQDLIIRQWRMALFRGIAVAVAQLCFYSALSLLELATISALAQTNALFAVIFSVIMFRERVGVWRIGALLLGFAGVLMVLRPGTDTFTLAALLPIGAAICYSFSIVSVRFFDDSVGNPLLYLYSSLASTVGALIIVVFTGGFSAIVQWQDLALIFGMSMAGGVAVLLLMIGYRMAPVSILAPFSYLSILTALLFGWLFFDELPVETLFPGVFFIVGAGVLILWREQRARRLAPRTGETETETETETEAVTGTKTEAETEAVTGTETETKTQTETGTQTRH